MQAAWHWATSVFGSLPEATKWLLICQHSLSGCAGAFRNENLFDDNVSLVVGDGGMEVEGILPLTVGEKLQQLVDEAAQKHNAGEISMNEVS